MDVSLCYILTMSKFKKTYRIESTRLKDWDYSKPWWYFVTICCHENKTYFGKVVKEKMKLNKFGTIANNCWQDIPKHYSNTKLDEYTIMPNHIHGIIILNNPNSVETTYMASLQAKSHTLGDIVGKYKAAVTRIIRKSGFKEFKWQSRFYDRIIRNERELLNIRNYIKQNPIRWDIEKSLPTNLDL